MGQGLIRCSTSLAFRAFAGSGPNQPVEGVGERAFYKKDTDGGSIYVLKGTATSILELHSSAQPDPLSAFKPLASKRAAKM